MNHEAVALAEPTVVETERSASYLCHLLFFIFVATLFELCRWSVSPRTLRTQRTPGNAPFSLKMRNSLTFHASFSCLSSFGSGILLALWFLLA